MAKKHQKIKQVVCYSRLYRDERLLYYVLYCERLYKLFKKHLREFKGLVS